MVYSLGFIFAMLPSFYTNHYRGSTEIELMQQRSLSPGYKLICGLQTNEQASLRHETVSWTLRIIACLSLLSIAVFKLVQGSIYAPYLWLELKVTNNTFLTAFVSSTVMFQYPIALIIISVMVVLRFTHCLVPMTESYDFSWRSYFINATCCVVWLIATISALSLLLFGTILEQVNYSHAQMQEKVLDLAQSALLDYECAGSRFWLTIVALVIPNAMILFKILSN